jgi:hypothetical protein
MFGSNSHVMSDLEQAVAHAITFRTDRILANGEPRNGWGRGLTTELQVV